MSKKFDDLVRRATCQMKIMLRERRRFKVAIARSQTSKVTLKLPWEICLRLP